MSRTVTFWVILEYFLKKYLLLLSHKLDNMQWNRKKQAINLIIRNGIERNKYYVTLGELCL